MAKSRKRQNMSGLRVVDASSCRFSKTGFFKGNVFGFVSRKNPFGILSHNRKGKNNRYKEDFQKLPLKKKNEVIRFFEEHPNKDRVYLVDPTLDEKKRCPL